MKLYYSPGACSLSCHIAINEAGLNCEFEQVDLKTHTYKGGDYYAINPKGPVPALELDNSEILTENAAILKYVADQAPTANLIPKAGNFARYRVDEWLSFISADIHKSFSPFFKPQTTPEMKVEQRAQVKRLFKYVGTALSKSEYIAGNTYSVADMYLFVMLLWSKRHEVDLSEWPAIADYTARVGSRPAVKKALAEEGLT